MYYGSAYQTTIKSGKTKKSYQQSTVPTYNHVYMYIWRCQLYYYYLIIDSYLLCMRNIGERQRLN